MKVKIKEWYELEEQYGIDEDGDIKCRFLDEDGDIICYCSFTSEMKEYCGEVIEVDELTLAEGIFMYDNWAFSDDMYEVIEE